MGWERKRGKLHEFNRLLRGAQDTSFLPCGGKPPEAPAQVKYVVTLDADTRLPIGAVAQLVGAAAHPLNAPRLDASGSASWKGYAILQPRVTPKLPAASESSLFQRLYSAPSGVDLYAGAVSDVYQDLFGEGSFTGKGLYDVDAFEASGAGRLPVDAVLSHDLLESAFARCALVSDVEVFEDFPYHAEVATARAHRWARGDWQLLPWIVGESRNRHRRDQPLEDARQSAPLPAGADGAGDPGGELVDPACAPAGVAARDRRRVVVAGVARMAAGPAAAASRCVMAPSPAPRG